VDPESELVEAECTLEALLGPEGVKKRRFVAAVISATGLVIGRIILGALGSLVLVAAYGRPKSCDWSRTTMIPAVVPLRGGNKVVREGNIENQVRTDSEFDFPVDVLSISFPC